MLKVTITISNLLHKKLLEYANNNGDSFSHTITKMAEIGLMITENEHHKNGHNEGFSDIEKHCFNLIIQMNALIKNMASETLGYGTEDFNKLLDLSTNKYKELTKNIS